jgi:hypothetical protein
LTLSLHCLEDMPPKLRKNLALFKLPKLPGIIDGYWLRRDATLTETPCRGYGHRKKFLSEFHVVRELAKTSQKRLKRRFKENAVFPVKNNKERPRWDLRVNLQAGCIRRQVLVGLCFF